MPFSRARGDELYGAVQALLRLSWTHQRIARHLGVSVGVVTRRSDPNRPPAVRASRAPSAHVQTRRDAVEEIAQEVVFVDDVAFPAFPTAGEIAVQLTVRQIADVSMEVVRRDLAAANLKCYVRKYDPTRDREHVRIKKTFCRQMNAKTPNWHRRTVYSDEHTVSLNDHTSRKMYARNRFHVIPREKQRIQNIPHVMMWAAIGHNFKSELVFVDHVNEKGTCTMTGDYYKRRCLIPNMPELLRRRKIFQQDGAKPHVKKTNLKYMDGKGLTRIKNWPAYSPDLSVIENVWPVFNARIAALHPTDLKSLRECAQKAWASFTKAEINKFHAGAPAKYRKFLRQKHH